MSKPLNITLLALGAVLFFGFSITTDAAPPLQFTENWSQVFVTDCGLYGFDFELLEDLEGRDKFILFFDQEGGLTEMMVNVNIHGTITNSSTGLTLNDSAAFQIVNLYEEDEQVGQIFSGRYYGVTIPGVGEVFREVGYVVLDLVNFEVTFEAGQRDWFYGGSAALCEALQ